MAEGGGEGVRCRYHNCSLPASFTLCSTGSWSHSGPGLAFLWFGCRMGLQAAPSVDLSMGYDQSRTRGRTEGQEGRRRPSCNFLRKWTCLREKLKCQASEGGSGLNDYQCLRQSCQPGRCHVTAVASHGHCLEGAGHGNDLAWGRQGKELLKIAFITNAAKGKF